MRVHWFLQPSFDSCGHMRPYFEKIASVSSWSLWEVLCRHMQTLLCLRTAIAWEDLSAIGHYQSSSGTLRIRELRQQGACSTMLWLHATFPNNGLNQQLPTWWTVYGFTAQILEFEARSWTAALSYQPFAPMAFRWKKCARCTSMALTACETYKPNKVKRGFSNSRQAFQWLDMS